MQCYVKHIALMQPYDIFVPKHHITFHLLFSTKYLGNPTKFATWVDESLNKTLKQACKNACAATFENSVLMRMQHILAETPNQKRPRQKIGLGVLSCLRTR